MKIVVGSTETIWAHLGLPVAQLPVRIRRNLEAKLVVKLASWTKLGYYEMPY